MRKYVLYIVCGLMVLSLPLFTSCDDDIEFVEEYVNAVSLQRKNGGEAVHILTHSWNGVTGNPVEESFFVKLDKAVEQDVKVKLVLLSPDIPTDKISLPVNEIVIKAGETTSEELLVSVPDCSFMAGNKNAVNYQFRVAIKTMETKAADTHISRSQNALGVSLQKGAYTVFEQGVPEESELLSNRNQWGITLSEGGSGSASDLIDGDAATGVSYTDSSLELTLDLKESYIVSGIALTHLPGMFPVRIEVLRSVDGQQWNSLGEYNHKAEIEENIKLTVPVETRYLKYKVLESETGAAGVAELNVYRKR